MPQVKMRIKNNLPKGVGMQICMDEPDSNLFPGKQRFVIEFLINRELTTDDIWALFGTMEGLEDDLERLEPEKAKEYKIHKLVFEDKKYFCYRVNYVDEKDTDINDIEQELMSTLEESIGSDMELLWSDIRKVRRFSFERGKKKRINIPEERLLKILNKKNK